MRAGLCALQTSPTDGGRLRGVGRRAACTPQAAAAAAVALRQNTVAGTDNWLATTTSPPPPQWHNSVMLVAGDLGCCRRGHIVFEGVSMCPPLPGNTAMRCEPRPPVLRYHAHSPRHSPHNPARARTPCHLRDGALPECAAGVGMDGGSVLRNWTRILGARDRHPSLGMSHPVTGGSVLYLGVHLRMCRSKPGLDIDLGASHSHPSPRFACVTLPALGVEDLLAHACR